MSTPRKILVLSLTRMGDIIQSIPFFRRLRLKHPAAQIHVLVEDAFAEVAALVPGIDCIHRVSLTDLLPPLAAGRDGDLSRATAFYRGLVRDLQAENFAEVWNLTHTRPFTLLNYLLAAEQGRGVTLDRQGLQLVNSPWLRYFFATNLARPWCQFNLVDIYANCIDGVPWNAGRELSIPVDAYGASSILPPLSPERTFIAVHPGASQASKMWPLDSYRYVAERLSRHREVDLVIIGGKPDPAVSAAFARLPRVYDYQGRTSPAELAALLAQSRLLLSNDSGPMHIAAAVGTRVLDITLGSALASETAPYGEGHLVVEPDSACFPCSPRHSCAALQCTARIPADAIAALAEWELGWRDAPATDDLATCRVYRTDFSSTDGLLDLTRLFHCGSDERDDLNRLLRPAWLAVLENRTPLGVESSTATPHALSTSAARARLLARQASGIASQLAAASPGLPRTLSTVQNLAALLGECEQSLGHHMHSHGLLRSLHAYSAIARASLTGDDLTLQAAETAQLYRNLQTLLTPLSAHADSLYEINCIGNTIEDTHEDLAERS